ncbi:bifunctional 2-C-methyl-D-erythritol 4-phosphate cytidylyltransferase/2-C-methyl-D-erythritol 2,4-cyclodiphosphate synthase [Hyphobacterium sp. HN65]|uniref:Bifunctional enzyme IspD/IspF n=1 Tax=Hyphobacterium lacteum TaxID=3116575 RepID=A0ABU7LM22_9PROT|nr:bifunctional 2-C-methyl-D-erythritol 4-phosphate cytidylyltransferase/2-C-methyl-D-erythritol 2,4-cyclodiphosphate synthase [Hyphobacterium sp. HN65]MEE2524942.1 bifunctional 2-C-methyl-D-erythritol 4-phosphate cytidylyltransferase/2-C-methyl-D-erythritol 2,4-cyclodiphosphate synthase [Hyphobacterium sp. HN65]
MPLSQKSISVVIVAAGRGQRAGVGLPKQFRNWDGEPVIRRTVRAFMGHPAISEMMVVIHPDDQRLFNSAIQGLDVNHCFGGDNRSDSVLAGLAALESRAPDLVLVHDGARPFISAEMIDRLIDAANATGAAIPVLPQTDATFTRKGDRIDQAVDRDFLVRAQTPQAFAYDALRAAFRENSGRDFPDEASLARAAGLEVALVDGDPANIKLTFAEDFMPDTATRPTLCIHGTGYDVHRLGPGTGVWLGGVLIPCPYELIGHSDADVALHALTDAILGAIGEGDIGQHFPPSEERWRGAASSEFVAHAVSLAQARNSRIIHADLTIICEVPKIGPHRDIMRERIAGLLALPVSAVNIKATTTEGLGFTGRKEGIAAHASVTVTRHE